MNKTSKILLGFLTGAVAGIVTGLLLAPDNPTEKEKGTKRKKDKTGDDLPPFFKEVKEDLDFVQKEMAG